MVAAAWGDTLRPIVMPPIGAMDVRATVQVDVADGEGVSGRHESPFRAGGTMVTVPPLVATGSAAAVESAATPLTTCTGELVSVAEAGTVSEIVAATPFDMPVAFIPDKMQVIAPGELLQLRDLLAADATGPTLTEADEKSAVE